MRTRWILFLVAAGLTAALNAAALFCAFQNGGDVEDRSNWASFGLVLVFSAVAFGLLDAYMAFPIQMVYVFGVIFVVVMICMFKAANDSTGQAMPIAPFLFWPMMLMGLGLLFFAHVVARKIGQ